MLTLKKQFQTEEAAEAFLDGIEIANGGDDIEPDEHHENEDGTWTACYLNWTRNPIVCALCQEEVKEEDYREHLIQHQPNFEGVPWSVITSLFIEKIN